MCLEILTNQQNPHTSKTDFQALSVRCVRCHERTLTELDLGRLYQDPQTASLLTKSVCRHREIFFF